MQHQPGRPTGTSLHYDGDAPPPSLLSLGTLAIAEVAEAVIAAEGLSSSPALGGVAGVLAVAPSASLPPGMHRAAWRLADYQLGACLHRGNAAVYKATCRLSGHTVVLKVSGKPCRP